MKTWRRFVSFSVLACLALVRAKADEVTVFAAASMTDALQAVAPLFAKATNHSVRFSFASSGTLVRQIEEGAPADVFLSADEARMDRLEQAGLILEGTRRSLLANRLVAVVAAHDGVAVGAPADLAAESIRRVAIGDPATVPAGSYARAYLTAIGQWDALQPRLVPLANVRAVLAAVETGNADVGFVYATDAAISKNVSVAFSAPPPEGPKIIYPVAIIRDTRHPDAARAFVTFLAGTEARSLFTGFGFGDPD